MRYIEAIKILKLLTKGKVHLVDKEYYMLVNAEYGIDNNNINLPLLEYLRLLLKALEHEYNTDPESDITYDLYLKLIQIVDADYADDQVINHRIQHSNITGGTITIVKESTWGTITGTITNQTDLVDYIDSKIPIITPYVLPVATTTILGGVKQGNGLTISADGTISNTQPTPNLQQVTDVGNVTTNQVKIGTTVVNSNYKLLVGGGLNVETGVLNMNEYASYFHMSGGRVLLYADGNGIRYRLFNNDLTDHPDTSKSFSWYNKGFEHMRLWSDALTLNGLGQPTSWHFKTRIKYKLYLPDIGASTGAYKVLTKNDSTGEIETVLASALGGSTLPANIVYTDNTQIIDGWKIFTGQNKFNQNIQIKPSDTAAYATGYGGIAMAGLNKFVITTNNIAGTSSKESSFDFSLLTSPRNYIWQDKAGTVALLDDITGGATTTANNGLTKTADNIQLGGSLLSNTNLYTGDYKLSLQGTLNGTSAFQVINTGTTSTGIYSKGETWGTLSVSDYGTGVQGTSWMGTGLSGQSTEGTGIAGGSTNGRAANFSINPDSHSNTAVPALSIYRYNLTTTAGSGSSIDYYSQTIDNSAYPTNRLASVWTDAAFSTRTSKFTVVGTLLGVESDKFIVKGSGIINVPTGPIDYADNAAALTGGLVAGDIYRTGDLLKIVH